ncbi:hypothetical protein B9Z19DRAFT_1126713 [Tuber borchii]|uniref:Uncharacterized protein n=1 Tax=Tuber borchii TaxID=42251 RepID=A0A2T6ZSN8_TUBBO|nr:hypothetical protein B9Z19DRAFT_1126713 [Tuber borchii]
MCPHQELVSVSICQLLIVKCIAHREAECFDFGLGLLSLKNSKSSVRVSDLKIDSSTRTGSESGRNSNRDELVSYPVQQELKWPPKANSAAPVGSYPSPRAAQVDNFQRVTPGDPPVDPKETSKEAQRAAYPSHVYSSPVGFGENPQVMSGTS